MEWRRAKSANGRLLVGNTMAQMELEVEGEAGRSDGMIPLGCNYIYTDRELES